MKTAKVYAMRDHRYQIEDLMTPELRENIKFHTKDLNFIIFLLLRNLKHFLIYDMNLQYSSELQNKAKCVFQAPPSST